jgi:hypothetical protein
MTKPLDDPHLQKCFGDAIEGALAFGAQGINPPPPGHWLQRFWDIGRAEREIAPAAAPLAAPVEMSPEFTDTASMRHLLDCINDPAKADELGSEENIRKTHASRYRSMLAAAPQAPSGQQAEAMRIADQLDKATAGASFTDVVTYSQMATKMLRTFAGQQSECGVCFETEAFTGTCGGGRENPRALCFRASATGAEPVADAQIQQWADRHSIQRSIDELRVMVDDARTLENAA